MYKHRHISWFAWSGWRWWSGLQFIQSGSFPGKTATVAETFNDYTNQRERRRWRWMEGRWRFFFFCIRREFTWGLHCCEALGLWNAVKYTVTDGCVNRGIQIKLDWSQSEGEGRLWTGLSGRFSAARCFHAVKTHLTCCSLQAWNNRVAIISRCEQKHGGILTRR